MENTGLPAPKSHPTQGDHPNAFLPPDGETQFPVVKQNIVSNQKAKEFLVAIGLTPPDLVDEVIETVLTKYSKPGMTLCQEDNIHDVTRIAAAAKTDSKSKKDRLVEALRMTDFLYCANAETGNAALRAPAQVHFDTAELRTYFSANPTAYFLSAGYDKALHEFFAELGVSSQVRCYFRPPGHNGHVVTQDSFGSHERGLNGFDPGFTIEGLDFALAHPTPERSQFVWNRLFIPHAIRIKGEVEESSRQDFSWSRKSVKSSQAGHIASTREWLPDRVGKWHKPKGLPFSDLPDGFQPSETAARQLEMEVISVGQLAEKTGLALSDIETLRTLIQTSPQAWEQIKQSLSTAAGGAGKPKFPQRTVGNPERREDKVREHAGDSPERTYEPREWSVRISEPDLDRQTWLMNQYTNEDRQMICQMCESEMPFKKRDGNYYFEAVEAFDHLSTERHELSLALCPVCAAKYKEFVKRDEANSAAFKAAVVGSQDTVIPVEIAQQQRSVRFVETHLFDLRIILGGRPRD